MSLPPSATALAPELAFVVQLLAQPHLQQAELAGRVEHIATGHTACFASLAELQAFMGKAASTG